MNFKGRPFKIIIYEQADCYEVMGYKTKVDEIKTGFLKHKHIVREVITTECDIIPITNTDAWIVDETLKDGQKATIKAEPSFCPDCGHVPFRFYTKDGVYCGRCLHCMGKYLKLKTKKKKKTNKKKKRS